MPEHVLRPGLKVIEAIAELGKCLGYDVEKERNIGNSGAAVDLAWYAAGDKWMPLMIFEVESKASSGMANNAMKVLSRDVDDFVKPLFLFHVVLKGGANNERIANLRRQWGSHNYRVYTLGLEGEVQRLILDILSQHRRVTNRVDIQDLSASLESSTWGPIDEISVLTKVRELNYSANYIGGLARVALRNLSLLSLYLDSLASIYLDNQDVNGRYGGYIGDYIPGLLEISILIACGRVADTDGPQKLEDWQERSGYGMRTIGPYFGLNRDYDVFILGVAPFIYGMASMLLRDHPKSYHWLTMDLRTIVEQEQRLGIPEFAVLPGALWLLHISASGLSLPAPRAGGLSILESTFELARALVNDNGGAPLHIVDAPPSYVDVSEAEVVDEWQEQLKSQRAMVPDWRSFNERYTTNGDHVDIGLHDAVKACIELLIADSWHGSSTYSFLCSLRKPPSRIQ